MKKPSAELIHQNKSTCLSTHFGGFSQRDSFTINNYLITQSFTFVYRMQNVKF